MTLHDIRLPRQLEVSGHDATILRVLQERTATLWPGGTREVSRVIMSEALHRELRFAALSRRMIMGLEAISEKLTTEARGIRALSARSETPQGERVSRLILCSRDGSERFYRRLEGLLLAQEHRVLGCLLDADSASLGAAMPGGGHRPVKVAMAEHKDAVSSILCAIAGIRR